MAVCFNWCSDDCKHHKCLIFLDPEGCLQQLNLDATTSCQLSDGPWGDYDPIDIFIVLLTGKYVPGGIIIHSWRSREKGLRSGSWRSPAIFFTGLKIPASFILRNVNWGIGLWCVLTSPPSSDMVWSFWYIMFEKVSIRIYVVTNLIFLMYP